jgi:uncharacterized protein (DUF305 family)
MRTSSSTHRIALSATAAIAAFVLSACGSSEAKPSGQTGDSAAMPGMTGMNQPPAAGKEASFNEADVAFAQMMIPDHQMTAKMAQLAKQKASGKELKSLAGQMLEGQQENVTILQGWLKTWGKPASADMAGMSMPGAMSDKDMTMLKSMKGMNFDMMFAQMMVKHHEGSIQMAKDEQAKGASKEAKAMAASMIETEQAEVEQLRKLSSM